MTELYLLGGLAGLWLASEIAISGAIDIANYFRVSRAFIGLTVIAIGTDVPEFFVSMTAAIDRVNGTETSGFIIGQIIGTCFSNVGLLLGLAGLITVLQMDRKHLLRDGLAFVAAALMLLLLSLDGEISRADGILLLVAYGLYVASLVREERLHEMVIIRPKINVFKSVVFLLGGFVLLGFAANLTVESALELSLKWGVAQSVVGALIVGLGTSLPEFATSVAAIRKGQGELAVGNLIGSSIIGILVVLGGAAMVSGLVVNYSLMYIDMVMLFVLAMLVFFVLWSRKRLSKREAALLLIAYIIYVGAKLGGTVN